MSIQLVRGSIVNVKADVIVNSAAPSLLRGGEVDRAIHEAAGPGLREECRTLDGCGTGCARLTLGHRLPCRYVIHTVGPLWRGGGAGEAELLASCYSAVLKLASACGCETVAFPLIASGACGYPPDQALRVAMSAIREFLRDHDMTVYLVMPNQVAYRDGARAALLSAVSNYIDRQYAADSLSDDVRTSPHCYEEQVYADMDYAVLPQGLNDDLAQMDESFSQALLRLIDLRGMTDAQCYKRANIDRKLFSKIRSNPFYHPSKATVLAFAVALELTPKETAALLRKAGFALSRSSKFDIIVAYFIRQGCYDIFTINETLFSFDQPLLGG